MGGLPSAGRTGRCRETVPSPSRHCFLFLRHRVPPRPVRRGRSAWPPGRWSPHPAEPSPGQAAASGAGARTGMSREPRRPRRLGCRRESDHSVPASPGGSDEQERVPQGVGPWRAGAARDPGFRARGGSQPLSGGLGWAGTVRCLTLSQAGREAGAPSSHEINLLSTKWCQVLRARHERNHNTYGNSVL